MEVVEGLLGFGGEGGQMEEETFPLRGSEGGFYMKVTLGIIEAAENLKLQ